MKMVSYIFIFDGVFSGIKADLVSKTFSYEGKRSAVVPKVEQFNKLQ